MIRNKIFTHNINFNRYKISPHHDLLTAIELFILIKNIRPDLVNTITIKPTLLGGLSLILFRKINFVVSITGLGFVFSREKSLTANIIKIIVEILYKLILKRKKIYFIFQNKYDLNVIRRILNKKITNFSLIKGSGVDLVKYSFLPLPTTKPIILFAARLLKSKGIYQFVEAAKKLDKYRFVIVGKIDSESDDCITWDELNYWENKGFIEYWGFKNNMNKIINLSNIVVLPSYYGEGLPKILIEAAACGRPVITTDRPGCKDAVLDGKTGFIIPVKNVDLIVEKINFILNNPAKALEISVNARNLALKEFNIKNVIEKHIEIYKEMIDK